MANIDKAMKVLRLKADHHKYRMSSLNGIQSLYFYSVWKWWFRFGQLKFQIDTFSVPYTFLPLRIPFFHLVYTSMHSFIIIFFEWRVVFFFEKKNNKLLLFSKILIQFREVVSATKLYSGSILSYKQLFLFRITTIVFIWRAKITIFKVNISTMTSFWWKTLSLYIHNYRSNFDWTRYYCQLDYFLEVCCQLTAQFDLIARTAHFITKCFRNWFFSRNWVEYKIAAWKCVDLQIVRASFFFCFGDGS